MLDDTVWRTAALLRPGGVMMADVLYGLSDYSHDEEDLAKVDSNRLEEMIVAEETRIEEDLVAVADRGDEDELADIEELVAAATRERRRRLWSPPPGFTVGEMVLNENDMGGHDVAVIVRRDLESA